MRAFKWLVVVWMTVSLAGAATAQISETERVELLRKANLSVVQVLATPSIPEFPEDSPMARFNEFFERDQNVEDGGLVSAGSGFIYDAQKGLILTASHILDEGQAPYSVLLHDNSQLDATVIERDDTANIAVLKIDPAGLAGLSFSETPPKTGETAFLLGRVKGLKTPFATQGMISGLAAPTSSDIKGFTTDLLMLDATLPFASGGGPVINSRGDVVGMATAIYSNDGVRGISLAIPNYSIVETLSAFADGEDNATPSDGSAE